MFSLTSSAFEHSDYMPRTFSCEGRDISPPLIWKDVPVGTKSFALVCEDPDAPGGVFYHWGLWNIPGNWRKMPEDFAPGKEDAGITQAVNDFGKPGYGGACPPKGRGTHHYHFTLYALNVPTLKVDGKGCKAVATAAMAHAIGIAQLTGLYQR